MCEKREFDVSMLQTAGIVHVQKRITYAGETHTINTMKTCNGGIYLHALDIHAVEMGRRLTYREEADLMKELRNADNFWELIECILKGDESQINSFRINTSHCDYDVYLNIDSMPQSPLALMIGVELDKIPLPSKTEKTPPVIDEINYKSIGILHIRRPFSDYHVPGGHYVNVVKTCNGENYARVLDIKALQLGDMPNGEECDAAHAAVFDIAGVSIAGFEAFENAVAQGDEMVLDGFVANEGVIYLKFWAMRHYLRTLHKKSAWNLLDAISQFMQTLPIPQHVAPAEGLASIFSNVSLDHF
jgi:hypothetical protein